MDFVLPRRFRKQLTLVYVVLRTLVSRGYGVVRRAFIYLCGWSSAGCRSMFVVETRYEEFRDLWSPIDTKVIGSVLVGQAWEAG